MSSLTVIVWLTELAFPHTSVKVHVLTNTKSFAQLPAVVTSTGIDTISPSQLSTAVRSTAAGTSLAH